MFKGIPRVSPSYGSSILGIFQEKVQECGGPYRRCPWVRPGRAKYHCCPQSIGQKSVTWEAENYCLSVLPRGKGNTHPGTHDILCHTTLVKFQNSYFSILRRETELVPLSVMSGVLEINYDFLFILEMYNLSTSFSCNYGSQRLSKEFDFTK